MLQLRNTKAYNCEVRSRTIFLWIILNDMKSLSSLRFEVYSFGLLKHLTKPNPQTSKMPHSSCKMKRQMSQTSFMFPDFCPTNHLHGAHDTGHQGLSMMPWHTHTGLWNFSLLPNVSHSQQMCWHYGDHKNQYTERKKDFSERSALGFCPQFYFLGSCSSGLGCSPVGHPGSCWWSSFLSVTLCVFQPAQVSLCFLSCWRLFIECLHFCHQDKSLLFGSYSSSSWQFHLKVVFFSRELLSYLSFSPLLFLFLSAATSTAIKSWSAVVFYGSYFLIQAVTVNHRAVWLDGAWCHFKWLTSGQIVVVCREPCSVLLEGTILNY